MSRKGRELKEKGTRRQKTQKKNAHRHLGQSRLLRSSSARGSSGSLPRHPLLHLALLAHQLVRRVRVERDLHGQTLERPLARQLGGHGAGRRRRERREQLQPAAARARGLDSRSRTRGRCSAAAADVQHVVPRKLYDLELSVPRVNERGRRAEAEVDPESSSSSRRRGSPGVGVVAVCSVAVGGGNFVTFDRGPARHHVPGLGVHHTHVARPQAHHARHPRGRVAVVGHDQRPDARVEVELGSRGVVAREPAHPGLERRRRRGGLGRRGRPRHDAVELASCSSSLLILFGGVAREPGVHLEDREGDVALHREAAAAGQHAGEELAPASGGAELG